LSIKNPKEWIPNESEFDYWLINSDITPHVRQPISVDIMKLHNILIADEYKDIDTKWTEEQKNEFIGYARVPGVFGVPEQEAQEMELKEAQEMELKEAQEMELKEAQEKEMELKEAQEKEAKLKEAQEKEAKLKEAQEKESKEQAKIIMEHAQKSRAELLIQEATKPEIKTPSLDIEFPQKSMIMTPAAVTSSGNESNGETKYFEGIKNGLRKIRNRSLKIDVLMNDLLDCKSQGFDVSAAFEPLELQKIELADFEKDIYLKLQEIIEICEEKAGNFK